MNNWWEMGGYGLYVWGSFGVVVLAVVIEQIALFVRLKSLVNK